MSGSIYRVVVVCVDVRGAVGVLVREWVIGILGVLCGRLGRKEGCCFRAIVIHIGVPCAGHMVGTQIYLI